MKFSQRSFSRRGAVEIRHAAVLGMSQEARDALAHLGRRLERGPVTLLGQPGPHRVLLDRARRAGALEGALEDAGAPTATVVIPLTGASRAQRTRWKQAGYELLDLSLPRRRKFFSVKVTNDFF